METEGQAPGSLEPTRRPNMRGSTQRRARTTSAPDAEDDLPLAQWLRNQDGALTIPDKEQPEEEETDAEAEPSRVALPEPSAQYHPSGRPRRMVGLPVRYQAHMCTEMKDRNLTRGITDDMSKTMT